MRSWRKYIFADPREAARTNIIRVRRFLPREQISSFEEEKKSKRSFLFFLENRRSFFLLEQLHARSVNYYRIRLRWTSGDARRRREISRGNYARKFAIFAVQSTSTYHRGARNRTGGTTTGGNVFKVLICHNVLLHSGLICNLQLHPCGQGSFELVCRLFTRQRFPAYAWRNDATRGKERRNYLNDRRLYGVFALFLSESKERKMAKRTKLHVLATQQCITVFYSFNLMEIRAQMCVLTATLWFWI